MIYVERCRRDQVRAPNGDAARDGNSMQREGHAHLL
jgi:hypothetical protein